MPEWISGELGNTGSHPIPPALSVTDDGAMGSWFGYQLCIFLILILRI